MVRGSTISHWSGCTSEPSIFIVGKDARLICKISQGCGAVRYIALQTVIQGRIQSPGKQIADVDLFRGITAQLLGMARITRNTKKTGKNTPRCAFFI